MEKDFFISYNRADRQWAEWIAWQLEEAGYTTVLQAWDFEAGSNFALKMHEASAKAKRTVAVLSPDYLGSKFAASEWAEAFAEDPTGELGLLLPVRVRECNPGGLLGQIVYVDLVGRNVRDAREALLAGVKQGRAKPSTEPGFPGESGSSVPQEPAFPGGASQSTRQSRTGTDFSVSNSDTRPPIQHLELIEPAAKPPDSGEDTFRKRVDRMWIILRRLWTRMPAAMKALTGLITAIGSLLTALAAAGILPPDPDPTPPPATEENRTMAATATGAPSVIRGELLDARIEPNVTLGDGCENRGWPCERFSEDQYPTTGLIVNFSVRLLGYTGRDCEVRWTLYDADTGDPVPNQRNQPGWPKGVIFAEGPDDQVRGEVWVPIPPRQGQFYVRLTLVNDLNTELDSLETERFPGGASP